MLEYKTPFLRKKIKAAKSVAWTFGAIGALAFIFVVLAYFGVQLGVQDSIYTNFESFFTVNKYLTYINPIYVRLIQILFHWFSFASLISIFIGGIILYLINPRPSLIVFGISFLCIALFNLFHFLTVEHVLFTKYPFAWSLFTWWETRMAIPVTLFFGVLIAICDSNIRTYTNKGVVLVTILFFAIFMYVFVYFSLGIETQPEFYFNENLDDLLLLALPLALNVVVVLPLLLAYYKREKSYFSLMILLSLIPQILAEAYTILDPNIDYYELLNFSYLLQLLGFIIPSVGLLLDGRMVYFDLQYTRSLAEENIQSKNHFISTFSYQLRTPLTSIIGQAECLLEGYDGDLNERQKDTVVQITKSTSKLSLIINEIIDIAKIESGESVYNPVETNLCEHVKACFNAKEVNIKAKNLSFSMQLPQKPVMILADPERVRQIILQFIDNALKFTNKGEIKLSVLEDESFGKVEVKDTGIGIASSNLAKIFTPYVQIQNKDTLKVAGIGLGLPIAFKFAKAMGGSIDVSSVEGKGSSFIANFKKIIPDKPPTPKAL